MSGATQSQATAIDNAGNILGTFLSGARPTSGDFVEWDGRISKLGKRLALNGLNDAGDTMSLNMQGSVSVVVVYNVLTHHATPIPGLDGPNNFGTGINDAGDVVGTFFSSPPIMGVNGWAVLGGTMYAISAYQGCYTGASGINNSDEIVGSYGGVEPSGNHGFVVTNLATNPQYETVDVPRGAGTLINAVNDGGELVGEYVDAAGKTHGFLATPR